MPTKPLTLRLMKLLLATWWWALIAGAVAFVVLVVAAPAENLTFAVQGYASDLDTSAFSVEDRDGRALEFAFDGPMPVKLTFPSGNDGDTARLGQRIVGTILVLPFFVVGLYFVKQLRDIVRTIDNGDPFAKENAGRVRTIGILILVFEMIVCLGRLVMSGIADSMARPQGFNLNGRIEFNESLIVVALAMIVLSEVFRHGARLREEQSLTI